MAAVEVILPRLGRTTNLHGFSVQEEATPLDPNSSAGGVGTITVVVDDFPDAPMLTGGTVLTDGSRGKTSGYVRDASAVDGVLTVTADSALSLLNAEHTIQPYVGTLGGAVQYYCDLAGVPNDVFVDPTIASRSVVYPGGLGNVWVRVKQMLSAEGIEMALVFNRIYVRPVRLLSADLDRLSTFSWRATNSQASHHVDVTYYNSRSGTNLEVYPLVDQEPQILVVDAGQTQVVEQQLNASLTSVNQPVATYNVANTTFEGTDGVYSITGVDDLPIQPAQWSAAGGSLSVRITDDPSVVEITVVGANIPHLSPFRIAMSSGSSNYYNSLHITGTGVAWKKETARINTGASDTTTSAEVGAVVDNPYIRTLGQAYSVGAHTAAAYSGLTYSVTGTAYAINRRGEGSDLVQATVEDFNMAYAPGTSVEDFNDEWAGLLISDFNVYWQEQVDVLWENQLFGNAPGARIMGDEANFRITSAVTTQDAIDFTADLDTTVGDFNAVNPGSLTVADFNARFATMTCRDFSFVPMRGIS